MGISVRLAPGGQHTRGEERNERHALAAARRQFPNFGPCCAPSVFRVLLLFPCSAYLVFPARPRTFVLAPISACALSPFAALWGLELAEMAATSACTPLCRALVPLTRVRLQVGRVTHHHNDLGADMVAIEHLIPLKRPPSVEQDKKRKSKLCSTCLATASARFRLNLCLARYCGEPRLLRPVAPAAERG